ncbi:unnamed protein product [Prorocentrum cordatum]|uniref:Uncharacterized protein n=1 Tax=Prorocentrum cordatum TaxID=2364126 RepID=A0ABN9UP28_9DINO|nr:unnamed protein product [Polarella glacialis]
MTAQFWSLGSVSTSWKRKTRIIKLAICRQAVFDVMQFNARDPYFVADPNTVPAFGWLDNLDDCARNPCPFQGNSEEQVNKLLSSLSVPTAGPTDRGEAFSSHSVAYSPDVAQSPDGGLQSRLGSVSFDPGVQNEEHDEEFAAVTKTASGYGDSWGFFVRFEPHRAEGASVEPGVRKKELHDEELQGVGLQNEELLNEQLHYSHHTYDTASRPEVCHTSASDGDSACHGEDWQGDLKDFKGEEEDNVHVESVESSTAVAAEEASLASQSNDAVLHSVPLNYSLRSAPLDYSLHSVPLDYSRVQRGGGGPEALPLASSKTHGECEVDQRKDNCASPSRLCSDELQSNRSECQAARDWARANDDAVALWREFERLPKEEFWARIEALKAYKLRMGIESPEEAPSPEEDAGRGKGDKEAEVDELHNNQSECDEDADSDAAFHAWDKMATQRVRVNFYLKKAALHRLCEALHRDGGEDADIQRTCGQCRLDKIRMHRIAGWCFGHWRCLTFYSSGAQRLMEQRLQSHIRHLRVTFWP